MNIHHNLLRAGLLGLAEQVALERGCSIGNLLKVPSVGDEEEPSVIAGRNYFWSKIRDARRDLTWSDIARLVGRDVADVVHGALPCGADPDGQLDPEDEVRA